MDDDDQRPALWVPFARAVLGRVVSGEYPPGTAIPTEERLRVEFKVSRTVVREGVKILQGKGLLRIDRGRGTMVRPSTEWRSFDAEILAARLEHGDRGVVLHEVLILRMALEPELAAGAARNTEEAALARLGARFDELCRASGDFEKYLRSDAAFHDCIAEISGISVGREIMRSLEQPVAIQRRLTGAIPDSHERSHAQHTAIFQAIRDRDPEAAWQAMREHLQTTERRLDDGILAQPVAAAEAALES